MPYSTSPRFPRPLAALILLAGAFLLLAAPWGKGQNSDVDPVFGGPGLGLAGTVTAVALQPDGKLLVAGGLRGLARLNADGSTDTSFQPDIAEAPSLIAVQRDGKILLVTGQSFKLSRLNADGSPDNGFNGKTGSVEILVLALQDDGKILVGSEVFAGSGGIARLKADGSLDHTFSADITSPDTSFPRVDALAIQPDGKIVIGGSFDHVDGSARNALARLNADGTLDDTYAPVIDDHDTSFDTVVSSLVLQADGKVVAVVDVGGAYRFESDGSADPSFQYGGGNFLPEIVALEPDGKMIFGTYAAQPGTPALIRTNADGSPDASFHLTAVNEIVTQVKIIPSVLPLADGRIIVGGPFTKLNAVSSNGVARLQMDGSVDTSFAADISFGPNAEVTNFAVQADGGIVMTGSFSEIQGVGHQGIARLKNDGTVDASFNPVFVTSAGGTIRYESAVQSDGRILVGGVFSSVNGVAEGGLVRLNSDGSLDSTFKYGGGSGSRFTHIAIQPDGKILGVPGAQYIIPKFQLTRLNADGRPDANFRVALNGTGYHVYINAVVLQDDGKILVGSQAELGVPPLLRLNADGSTDDGFNPGIGATGDDVTSAAVQADGKVLMAGSFARPTTASKDFLVRLNSDGSLDPGFSASVDGLVNSFAVKDNGTIVIGGGFTHVNGLAQQGLAVLAADGSVNPFLTAVPGTDGTVNVVTAQPDGKVLVGGSFTRVNGVQLNFMARLGSKDGVPDFFGAGTPVGGGFYYLQWPGGNSFGYYNLAGDGYNFPYFYHADLGMEYFFDAQDNRGGAYLYDFASGGFFYSGPQFPWPYLYDFTLNTVLYYYPDPSQPDRYNTDGIRYFYNFATGQIITK